ncbi:ribonuclease H-like domain-containing protein [Tanacetum coccineum]
MRLAKLPMHNSGSLGVGELRSNSTFRSRYAFGFILSFLEVGRGLGVMGIRMGPIPVTSNKNWSQRLLKMTVPSTAEEKTAKKNDVKARSLSAHGHANEHQTLPSIVKKSVGTNNDDKNLAFLTTSGASSTNIINTANPEVSTGYQLVQEDLEQLHDDTEALHDGKRTAGYDKSKGRMFQLPIKRDILPGMRAPGEKTTGIWNQAERKNMTLIEAARTMLADSKLPTTFWAEAVSTACYVQNRVLIVKPHNKTPYELFRGNQGVFLSLDISQIKIRLYCNASWKDASYFGDDAHQVLWRSFITGSRDDSIAVPEVITATPEGLWFRTLVMHLKDTQVEVPRNMNWGNILQFMQHSVQDEKDEKLLSLIKDFLVLYMKERLIKTFIHVFLLVSSLRKNQKEFLKLLVIQHGFHQEN